MPPVRLVFVYQFIVLGGVEVVLHARLRELLRRGHDAHAIFLSGGEGKPLFADLAAYIHICPTEDELAACLKRLAPDWLITTDTPAVLPVVRRVSPSTRLAYEVKTTYPAALAPLLDPSTFVDLLGLLVTSPPQADLVADLIAAPRPIAVVPNCLSEAFLSPPETPAPGRPIVAWVGRLDPLKNWRAFIRLARHVRDKVDVQFWLIGGGQSPPRERDDLTAAVAAADLEADFRWLPSVPHTDMPDLYATVSASGGCLVSTSLSESWGMAVLEAQAARCPVVASNVGGLQYLIRHGESGFLFEPGDIDTAASLVLKVLRDPRLRQSVIAAALQAAHTFTPAHSVDRLLDTLDRWSEIDSAGSDSRASAQRSSPSPIAPPEPPPIATLLATIKALRLQLVTTAAVLNTEIAERDRLIQTLQSELLSQADAANQVIRALQTELHTQAEAASQMISALQIEVGRRDTAIIELQTELHTRVTEANTVIHDLQAQMHAKIAEANQVIQDLQVYMHTTIAEANAVIADLQAQLQRHTPPSG